MIPFWITRHEACLPSIEGFDGYKNDWGDFNISDYTYTCSNSTPYHYRYYYNVSLGTHTFKVEQKDCTEKILATSQITFLLSKVDDIFTLEVLQ